MARKKFDVVDGESILDSTKVVGFVDGVISDVNNDTKTSEEEPSDKNPLEKKPASITATPKETSKKSTEKQTKETGTNEFKKSLMRINSRERRERRITLLAKPSVEEKFLHYVEATGAKNGNEFFEYLMLNLDKILDI